MFTGSSELVMLKSAAMIQLVSPCRRGFLGPSAEDAMSYYDRVVETKAPFTAPNGKHADDETLFLPLSDDGKNVTKILVFSYSRDIKRYAESTGL